MAVAALGTTAAVVQVVHAAVVVVYEVVVVSLAICTWHRVVPRITGTKKK